MYGEMWGIPLSYIMGKCLFRNAMHMDLVFTLEFIEMVETKDHEF